MPPMPGSALVVIKSEFIFRGLKTVLDRPTMAFDRHQRFDGCCRWTPCGEEGEITIGDMTTDQQTACPKTLISAAKGLSINKSVNSCCDERQFFGVVRWCSSSRRGTSGGRC